MPGRLHQISRGATSFLVLIVLGGCSMRVEPPDFPPPRDPSVQPGPEPAPGRPPNADGNTIVGDPHVVQPSRDSLPGRLSDAEKQDVVHNSLLNLQRLVVSTDERMDMSNGRETTTVAADLLSSKLAEMGFRVTQSTSRLPYEPSERHLDDFRSTNDCNLAIVIEGGAEERDRFGSFWAYKSDLKGKVLNLTTHQVIAAKTVRKAGRRALDERDSAIDALESAAKDLVAYLTDEVARKWEATSLVRMKLVCTDLGHIREADDVRIGLQRRPGVYYVSLEKWDDRSARGVFEVLCRFDVQRFLASYVDELRLGSIRVESVRQAGKIIKADQDFFD